MSIKQKSFGKTKNGDQVDLYTLSNGNGLTVEVMTYGATLTSVETPDRDGESRNITLGMPVLDDYIAGHPLLRLHSRAVRQPHRGRPFYHRRHAIQAGNQ